MLRPINKDFSIERKLMPPSYSMTSPHSHNVYELYYMESGTCSIYLNSSIYRITSGTFLMIPPYCHHKTTYLSDNNHMRTVIHFTTDEFSYYENELNGLNLSDNILNKAIFIPENKQYYANDLIQKIISEASGIDRFSVNYRKLYCTALFLFLLRCQLNIENVINKVDVKDELIQQIIEYIFRNYGLHITLADTAKKFGISESGLSKKFKEFSGHRFKEYLILVRVNAAKDLLVNTNKSLSEISETCGFGNTNFFGDTFKKITGMSPNAYRKHYIPYKL